MMRSLTLQEYLSSFSLKPNKSVKLFLGSGASIQSGIPTGNALTWEFKKKIYCREKNISEEKYKDMLAHSARETIQSYLELDKDSPPLHSPQEYSYYFEKYLPLLSDRKNFINTLVAGIKPSTGYLCLGNLFLSDKINLTFTTNFDELIENGLKTISPTTVIKTLSESNISPMNWDDNHTKVIKLHGDFKYDKLQNTTTEIQKLEKEISLQFENALLHGSLLVVGYSGNDESVMSVLEDGLCKSNFLPNGIVWCKLSGSNLSSRAEAFMLKACELNSSSCVVDINSFDEFLYKLYKTSNVHNEEIEKNWKASKINSEPIRFKKQTANSNFLKTNSFLSITIPHKYIAFSTDIQSWKELKELINENPIVCSLYKGKVYSFGSISQIQSVFGEHIKSAIAKESLPNHKLRYANSIELGMYYDLIFFHLMNNKNLTRCGRRKFYDNTLIKKEKNVEYYEAIEIALTFINGKIALTMLPTIEIKDENNRISRFDKQRIYNTILSNRSNKEFNNLIFFWNKKLCDETDEMNTKTISAQIDEFEIVFNGIAITGGGKDRKKEWDEIKYIKFDEPTLTFSHEQDSIEYVNQLNGLINNAPIDTRYQTTPLNSIKLAVLSPKTEVAKIITHLNRLNQKHTPKFDKPFLRDYNGFEQIYKRKIIIPKSDDKLIFSYDTCDIQDKTPLGFFDFTKQLIDRIQSHILSFDVLILFFPQQFSGYRDFKTDIFNYDFHDAIKLYCADKGIKLQIIEERSLSFPDIAKVMWGLSIGLYVKANGDLWIPKSYNPNTAFIGISYSVSKEKQNRFYLGCSQLFDSVGNGMKLILRQLYNPTIIRRNPYMKSDDAFKMISELRNSYHNLAPLNRLNRIVIHKTTEFTFDEIQGINQALGGIDDVELIQIQEYSDWRAIPFVANSYKDTENYPIKRGTVVPIDDRSFLLWTHGSIIHEELSGERYNYIKGGRSMPPAPLLIKRFQGKATGDELANEILMLTKMNFNSGDSLYKMLPVTLDFSKTLSKIAKQKIELSERPYDFRFFM